MLYPTAKDPIVIYLSVVIASGNFSEEAPSDVAGVDKVGSAIVQLLPDEFI